MKSKRLVLFLMLPLILTSCQTDRFDNWILSENEGLKSTLVMELIGHDPNGLLYQKITNFAEERQNLEISIRNNVDGYYTPSKWILGGEELSDPPDILELTPNQMKILFHHGKIESLGLQEPQYQDYLIHSPDGYILGVKTKINPLVLYYNREIFRQHGIDFPTNDWDWTQFEQVITLLKDKGENVYILTSPHLLEWLTINRYGGQVVDVSGMVFSGYLDSEEAVQAAEWLAWVNTQYEDYRLRLVGGNNVYWPMPYDLIEDNIALAVDYPYYLQYSTINSYVSIMERNERIGIATLPGAYDVINPALISGLAIHSGSKNKEAAMALLRYLIEDSDDFYRDTVVQTHYGAVREHPNEGSEEWSVVLKEARRSYPLSLIMNEGHQWQIHSTGLMHKLYRAVENSLPAKEVLQRYAEEFDQQFVEFRNDLENYHTCLKQSIGICQQ